MDKHIKRMIQLKNRYEYIIELNRKHHYATTLVPERKTAQYFRVLLAIKKERWDLIDKNTNAEKIKQGLANLVLTNKSKL